MHNAAIIGLISDTHGLLRPEAITALQGSGLILHAGDVGNSEILDRLRSIAPIVAIRGNIDTAPWAAVLPETTTVEAAGIRLYVLHDLQQLAVDPVASNLQVIVSGHSHKPGQSERAGVLYINPGSAGPRRFRLPITVARLDLRQRPLRAEFIPLLPEDSPML